LCLTIRHGTKLLYARQNYEILIEAASNHTSELFLWPKNSFTRAVLGGSSASQNNF